MACCPNCAIVAMGSLGDDSTLVWWPGAIKGLRGEVDGIYQNLGRDFRQAKDDGLLNPNTWAEAQRLMQEWLSYKKSLGITDWLWGSTVGRLNHYKGIAIEWRNKLRTLGAEPTGPDPNLNTSDTANTLVTAVKYISVAAVIVGISYVGGKALGIIPKR